MLSHAKSVNYDYESPALTVELQARIVCEYFNFCDWLEGRVCSMTALHVLATQRADP
jgi:hypothetical protein